MGMLAAPFLAAAVLLVVAGGPKLLDPAGLRGALASVGGPRLRRLARPVAAVEVAVGAAAVVRPDAPTAGAVCVAYLSFTGFVLLALARGGVLASCGCFGKVDTPPSRGHVVLTLVLAAAALGVMIDGLRGTPAPWWSDAGSAAVSAGYALLIAFLAYLVLAVLPTTTAAAVRRSAGGVASTSPKG